MAPATESSLRVNNASLSVRCDPMSSVPLESPGGEGHRVFKLAWYEVR